MIFQRKYDRASRWSRRKRIEADGLEQSEEEALPSLEELKREGQEDIELEKGDIPAMMISAFITIFPACILALLVMAFLALLLAGALW